MKKKLKLKKQHPKTVTMEPPIEYTYGGVKCGPGRPIDVIWHEQDALKKAGWFLYYETEIIDEPELEKEEDL